MSAAPADVVGAHLDGVHAANRCLDAMRTSTPHPDALHQAAMKAWADAGSPGLLAFHRAVQKRLERTA